MSAQVAHHSDDIVGDEPTDRSAGVDADNDPAGRVEHDAGGLQVHRIGVDECPGQRGDGLGVHAVADGKRQLVLGDQGGGGLLVVDRQGGDAYALVGQACGPLEGAQLRVAVGAPRATEEEHDADVAVERVGNGQPDASGGGDRQPRERVAWGKQGHGKSPLRWGRGGRCGGFRKNVLYSTKLGKGWRPLMESYDVVIVGYGPTGCLLALQLGRCGRRVLVLERQEAGYPLPRAAHLDDEVCRMLQGVGLPPTAMPDLIEPYEDFYEWRGGGGGGPRRG